MKLSVWARQNGLTYKTAWRMFKEGRLPHPTKQLPTGTILIFPEQEKQTSTAVVLYARVSSRPQKADLERQLQRLRDYAARHGYSIMKEVTENCPCCKSTLVIDPESGGIIKHKAFKETPKSLDEFLKSEKTRNNELAAKFAAAKEKEETKLNLLDKKFEWAKKNKDKLPEAPKPDLFWD